MLHVFIINIKAGKNNGPLIGKIVEEYCKSKNVNYIVNYVYSKEDTNKIINKYKSFEDTVIYSVGGDGTLNQVINYMANTNLWLNIIPTGTGNDFYKTLNDYNGDRIDLGKVNDRYFINVASFGIDAEIANTANEFKNKNIKGKFIYPLSILKNYFPYKSLDMNIDDQNKLMTIVAICNGCFYGGGFNISPKSKINDGLFDIYEVENLNKIEILNLIIKLVKGKHIYDKRVKTYKTDKIKIESNIDLNCNLDGEIIKGKSFDFSICKDSIKLDKDELKIKELLKSKRIIK